jgi:hypothetical protein
MYCSVSTEKKPFKTYGSKVGVDQFTFWKCWNTEAKLKAYFMALFSAMFETFSKYTYIWTLKEFLTC